MTQVVARYPLHLRQIGEIAEDWRSVKTAMLTGPLLDLTLALWTGDFHLAVVQLYADLHPAHVLVNDDARETGLRLWSPHNNPELAERLLVRLDASAAAVQREKGDDVFAALRVALAAAIGPVVDVPVYRYASDTVPHLDAIRALDGKIFATLNSDERAVLDFCRTQGRKSGVNITIVGDVDEAALAAATSELQADEVLRRGNNRVIISVTRDTGTSHGAA